MRLIEGCAGVGKLSATGDVSARQDVRVADYGGYIKLTLSECSYPAILTPEEGRHVARCLLRAARRIEKVAAK